MKKPDLAEEIRKTLEENPY